METKVCTKCKQEFPATTEYFRKQKNGKYNVGAVCHICAREIRKLLYSTVEYKEKHAKYAVKWRQKNPDKVKKANQTSYNKNGEIYNKNKSIKYYNDVEYQNRCKERDKKRKRNKEHFSEQEWIKILTIRREYRDNFSELTKEKIKEKSKQYRLNNHDYFLTYDKNRREALTNSYVAFTIAKQLKTYPKNIPDFIIEAKRNQLKLHRECQQH